MLTVEQQRGARVLKTMITQTFCTAYARRLEGASESELLIDFDIEAAFQLVDDLVAKTCRNSIKAAVSAVDERVPFALAIAYLLQKIDRRIVEMLRELPEQHAVDKDQQA